jgi:membrane protein DedA with SNARE-associated domain
MITDLIEFLANSAKELIEALGYYGVVLRMAIESINIQLPSEALVTFAGALIAEERFSFWPIVSAGAVGNVIGSVGNYYRGAYGGRPFTERYGRYFQVHHRDLEIADRWFAKYGLAVVFFTRLLPVVRTFISFPAGVSHHIAIGPFIVLTFSDFFLWSALLTYLGLVFGRNYAAVIRPILHRFDFVIGVLLFVAVVWYIKCHLYLHKKS